MTTICNEPAIDWTAIKKFNFTFAIPGGAWLEWKDGTVKWYSFTHIAAQLGQVWIDRQLKKQGWMTGCWIEVA